MIDKILNAYGNMIEKITKSMKEMSQRTIENEYARMWVTANDLAKAEIEAEYESKKSREEFIDVYKMEEKFKKRVDFHLENMLKLKNLKNELSKN